MNNQEANMKTVLNIAKECGAEISDGWHERFIDTGGIIFETEAQLTTTIEAWNRQNSEPVAEVSNYDGNRNGYALFAPYPHVSFYDGILPPLGTKFYLAPQQPPASQELLDYVDRLEALVERIKPSGELTMGHQWVAEVLQSKPAKG